MRAGNSKRHRETQPFPVGSGRRFYRMIIGILLVLCLFLFCRVQVWKDRYEDVSTAAEKLATEGVELRKNFDFLKESIASWNTKPVYALLSDQQIADIGKTVGQYIKEPKWLN
jgi:hypothetical protein